MKFFFTEASSSRTVLFCRTGGVFGVAKPTLPLSCTNPLGHASCLFLSADAGRKFFEWEMPFGRKISLRKEKRFPFRGSVSVSGRMLSFGRGGFFSRVISFGRSVVFSELSFLEMSFLLERALLVCKGVTFSADVAGNVFVRDKESGRLANPYSPSASRYSLPF